MKNKIDDGTVKSRFICFRRTRDDEKANRETKFSGAYFSIRMHICHFYMHRYIIMQKGNNRRIIY